MFAEKDIHNHRMTPLNIMNMNNPVSSPNHLPGTISTGSIAIVRVSRWLLCLSHNWWELQLADQLSRLSTQHRGGGRISDDHYRVHGGYEDSVTGIHIELWGGQVSTPEDGAREGEAEEQLVRRDYFESQ